MPCRSVTLLNTLIVFIYFLNIPITIRIRIPRLIRFTEKVIVITIYDWWPTNTTPDKQFNGLIPNWLGALLFSSSISIHIVIGVFIPKGTRINFFIPIVAIRTIGNPPEYGATQNSSCNLGSRVPVSIPVFVLVAKLCHGCSTQNKKQKGEKVFHN